MGERRAGKYRIAGIGVLSGTSRRFRIRLAKTNAHGLQFFLCTPQLLIRRVNGPWYPPY